jgi:hypothetical protein
MTDKVSKAPPPIAPIRGLSLTPAKPIDWSHWKLMTGVQLREAVSLSVGINPDIRTRAGEKFDKRLRVAESHAETGNLPISAQSTVTLAQFADWGLSVGIDMPPELVAMAKGTQPAPAQDTVTPKPVEPASDSPAIPKKSKRPDLLTPLIEAAQRGETDPFSAAVIWPKMCDMAEKKRKPLLGKTEDGIQWLDGNDDTKFLSLKRLRDRLARQAKSRAIARQSAINRDKTC